MELHSDAQLLKAMLIAGACYHRLIKEIQVKNKDIPHGLLSFSFKLNVGKYVLVIVSNICAPIVETNLVFDEKFLSFLTLTSYCYYCYSGVTLMIVVLCSCSMVLIPFLRSFGWRYVLVWLTVVPVKLLLWILKLTILFMVPSMSFFYF